jgi:single-strand DNA-binding protein
MSLNVNTVILAGHLTRDPELRSLAGDKVVTNFSLAINRRYKGADGEIKEDSTFVDCEAWGRTAELVGQYLAKGSAAYVEGRLRLDAWQDKEGKHRTRLKVVVDNVQFVGPPKPKAGTPAGETGAPAGETVAAGAPSRASHSVGRPAAGLDEPPF